MHNVELTLLSRFPSAPLLSARLFLVNARVLALRGDAGLHSSLDAVHAAGPGGPWGVEFGLVGGCGWESVFRDVFKGLKVVCALFGLLSDLERKVVNG